jgi:uncharacterized protein YjbI with pentapeptide repeats
MRRFVAGAPAKLSSWPLMRFARWRRSWHLSQGRHFGYDTLRGANLSEAGLSGAVLSALT